MQSKASPVHRPVLGRFNPLMAQASSLTLPNVPNSDQRDSWATTVYVIPFIHTEAVGHPRFPCPFQSSPRRSRLHRPRRAPRCLCRVYSPWEASTRFVTRMVPSSRHASDTSYTMCCWDARWLHVNAHNSLFPWPPRGPVRATYRSEVICVLVSHAAIVLGDTWR